MLKQVLWMSASLSLLAGILGTWLAPKAISWYFDPPVQIGVNCKAATVWAMSRLVWAQGICLILGAVLGALAAFWWLRRAESKPANRT